MNEERTGKCLRQVEHIRGHLWHRYSITVNQVQVLNSYVICSDTFCHQNFSKRCVNQISWSIENLTKIVMDSVKNYVRQCTNHVREDIQNLYLFPNRFKLWSRRNTIAFKIKTKRINHNSSKIYVPLFNTRMFTFMTSLLMYGHRIFYVHHLHVIERWSCFQN